MSKHHRKKKEKKTVVTTPRPASPVVEQLDNTVIPTLTSALASAAITSLNLPKDVTAFASKAAAEASKTKAKKITLGGIWGVIKQHKIASTLVGLSVAGAGIATGVVVNSAVTAIKNIPGVFTPMTLLSLVGQSEMDNIILNHTEKLELPTGITVIAQSLGAAAGANNPHAYAILGAKKVLETANTYICEHEDELRSSLDSIAGYN